jgi:Flp pilus assembly pilin Flp
MKKLFTASALLFLLPAIAFAEPGSASTYGPGWSTSGGGGTVTLGPLVQFVAAISKLEVAVIPVLIAAALIAFFYGLIRYILIAHKGAAAAANSRSVMIYGLIALFVMISVWGIIRIAQQAVGITGNEAPSTPIIPALR